MSARQDAVVRWDSVLLTKSITRAANATPYSINDAISASDNSHMIFTDVVETGALMGFIYGAVLHSSANKSTKLDCEAFVFRSDFTDMEDNDAFDPSDAEMLTCLGVLKFRNTNWIAGNDTADGGGNALCHAEALDFPIKANWTNADGGRLFVGFKAKNAYTPVSAEILTLDLFLSRD